MNLQMIEQSPLVLGAGELWPNATSGEFLSAIRDVEPYTATTAYTDFLLRVAGDDFGLLCARLESLLDEIASNSPAVHDAYRYAMQCELDFFSAPMKSEP